MNSLRRGRQFDCQFPVVLIPVAVFWLVVYVIYVLATDEPII